MSAGATPAEGGNFEIRAPETQKPRIQRGYESSGRNDPADIVAVRVTVGTLSM